MVKYLCTALLCGLSFAAFAQPASDQEPGGGPARGWQIGLATVVADSPYAGEGSRVIPIPLLTYQGERAFFRGISAGWTLFGLGSFELAALAKLRLDGFKIRDLGREELAANGLDSRRLEDRDNGLDAGLGLTWSGGAGKLDIELLSDIADKSGGEEFSVQYGYPTALGGGMLTPNIGATWLSKDMANYYYGTREEEVARGVAAYRPGAVTIPHMGLTYFRPLGETWTLLGNLKYSALPEEIKASPLIEPGSDATASLFVGFSRPF